MGSLNFLGKERVRFPITNEHSSLVVFSKKFAEFAGSVKAEAEKRGIGSCIELKFCRLEKRRDGSKAFAINTQTVPKRSLPQAIELLEELDS